MRTAHSWGVTFAMAAGETGFRMVTDANFALEAMPEGADEGKWVDGLIKMMSPDALIMDFRTDLRGSWVKGWREKGVLIVDIDDLGDRRLESDLAFYPPVPQVNEMDWQGFEGKLFSGWEWVILRRQFSDPPGRPASKPGDPPVILVTMGGSDPAGLTVRALRVLDLVEEKFRVITVVGRGFSQRKDLAQVLREVSYPVEVLEDVDDMASVMSKADLAIASFGVTAYELAVMGVPAVFLCLTEDHARSASLFEEAGIGVNLGVHSKVREGEVRKALMKLLADPVHLKGMSQEASSLVDGRGAARAGALMVEKLGRRNA